MTFRQEISALLIFGFLIALVFLLEALFEITGTKYYWIYHFIFGVGMPYFFYAILGRFSWAIFPVIGMSIINEIVVDGFDWAHFFSDMAGIAVSLIIYRYLISMKVFHPA